MGIKGLNPLLKRYAPQAFGELSLDKLKGGRVAIDAYNWIHTAYPSAKKDVAKRTDVSKEDIDEEEVFRVWMDLLFDFIKKWVNHSITPVFVFDGEYPMEKSITRKKRREAQNKTKERMLELQEKIRNTDPLFITSDMIEELRKKITNTRSITADSMLEMKKLLYTLGIPYIQAKYEGEQLCSMLALEGVVSAVFSTDTDNIAYGAPLLITKFSGYEWKSSGMLWKVKCVWYENILKQLDYTREKFVDLCILGGCDYNDNIPRVGIPTAYKILNEYHSIDNFPPKYDIKCLKHRRCREMFRAVPSKEIWMEGFIDYQIQKLHLLKPHLEDLEIFEKYYYLGKLLENLRVSTTLHIPDPPPLPITRKYSNVTLIIQHPHE